MAAIFSSDAMDVLLADCERRRFRLMTKNPAKSASAMTTTAPTATPTMIGVLEDEAAVVVRAGSVGGGNVGVEFGVEEL